MALFLIVNFELNRPLLPLRLDSFDPASSPGVEGFLDPCSQTVRKETESVE